MADRAPHAASPAISIPVLSIIVPVYGVEDYVGDCLDSILAASGFTKHCELVIVDDGSKDGSMAIVERRCAGIANVTIIRQANAGLSAARNTGLANARGRYLWFVDSDDEICADAITTLTACIARFSPDVIAFEFATMGGSLDRPPYLAVFDQVVDPVQFIASGRPPSPVQFYAFSRDLIERNGQAFTPGIYHEDTLFTPLALVRARSLVRLRATCYRYRLLRPGSIMMLSRPEKHLSDMLSIAEELGAQAGLMAAGSALQRALAREVGFALASARYYAVRTNRRDRHRAAPFVRVLAAGARWWRHFPLRVLVNYGRLLALAAAGAFTGSASR